MRQRVLAAVALALSVVSLSLPAGTAERAVRAIAAPEPFCRIYLDPHDKFTRVVPEPLPQGSAALVEGDAVLSTITVNYTGFTQPAQSAFQAAVDIWKTQVKSTVPIVVDADFSDLGSTGLLGQAGSTCAFSNFTGVTRADTWFPAPIASRLRGVHMTGCSKTSDISASFNSTASWYYGTDGFPPAGTVDFVSVVLHELGHGLGYVGVAQVTGSGLGTVGSGFPYIYDTNVVDSVGTSVLDTTKYPANSTALGTLLTSGGNTGSQSAGIFWNGTSGVAANSGVRPKLYAPAGFSQGSTYSHVDEVAFPPGDINSLMTPFIGRAEAIHVPGPIMLGMFNDMGWGTQCSFGLDQTTATVPAAGGNVNVALSTAAGCGWTVWTSSTFVTFTSAVSGTSSAIIKMTVAPNTAAAGRTAVVTIGDQTLTIGQAGTTPCAYALNPTSANIAADGATGSVSLTTATGCAWTASSSNMAVATVSPSSGVGAATIAYSVSGNPGAASRAATLTIGGQAFAVTQNACSYSVTPASMSVSGNGATLSVAVSAPLSCLWTSSTASSFVTVTRGATAAGPDQAQFSFVANMTGSPRSADITVAGQTFTITQGLPLPVMSLDRTVLRFSAVTNSVVFTSQTGAQAVRLTQTGTGTVTWTAASTVPWLAVTPSSGSGSATLSISTAFAAGLGASQPGNVTLTFMGASGGSATINVTLTTINVPQTAAPFGAFDTPADGSTGVTGSIPVTGWALDDVEIARVRILRDPVAGEPAGVPIFLGNAVFVDGARPDVQALNPNIPRSSRAGWGYLLLTNFLPGLGNGTFKLYAIADDADGHSTVLGSKTITCANSTATTPFGAIDTPSQGETVSGVINNFGWVLSPGMRHADPPNGGSVSVFIDGVAVGSPTGWGARSDLTTLFPAAQFSGVSTALGVFTYDTTRLTNGVHTISWLVTDNQGGASGVGSRYFTVSNGSGLMLDPDSFRLKAEATSGDTPWLPPASSDSWLPPSGGRIVGRRGFDLSAPYQTYPASADGVITIQAEELDRIELLLGPGAPAFARNGRARRPLPIGSHLDPSTGTFTWQPGVGFAGTYDFVLGGRDVRIVLNPKGSGRVGPQVVIDLPVSVKEPILVAGWAADLDSQVDSGVDTVHVWAYPVDGGDPIFLGAAEYGGARPDVAAIYGERFLKSGYGLRVEGLAPGTYDVAVFAYSTVTGGFVPAKTVRLTIR